MDEQQHTSLRSLCAMPSMDWRGVKLHHWTLEQWNRVLWSDGSLLSIWQSDEGTWVWWMNPGGHYLLERRVSKSKVWWSWDNGLGRVQSLDSDLSYRLPALCSSLGRNPFLFQLDHVRHCAQSQLHKDMD